MPQHRLFISNRVHRGHEEIEALIPMLLPIYHRWKNNMNMYGIDLQDFVNEIP